MSYALSLNTKFLENLYAGNGTNISEHNENELLLHISALCGIKTTSMQTAHCTLHTAHNAMQPYEETVGGLADTFEILHAKDKYHCFNNCFVFASSRARSRAQCGTCMMHMLWHNSCNHRAAQATL